MRLFLLYFLLCAGQGAFAQKARLDVKSIMPGFWVHTSYNEYKGSLVPSNGLIVELADSVLIIDTGWGEKPTKLLLRWVKKNLKKPVKLLIVTHSHEDRTGGIALFQKKKIPIAMSKRTAKILSEQAIQVSDYQEIPDQRKDSKETSFYECFYPGAGHTVDNMVVYFKDAQLLFGGCFVKSLEARDMGNVSDADLKEWPKSIQHLKDRFPKINIIVPGHQAWGNDTLLQHTLDLLKTAPK